MKIPKINKQTSKKQTKKETRNTAPAPPVSRLYSYTAQSVCRYQQYKTNNDYRLKKLKLL